MPNSERESLNNHSINIAKYILLVEKRIIKLYLSKLTSYNKYILINILCILITQFAVGCLNVKPDIVEKLEIITLIVTAIMITYIFLGCLIIIKLCLICEILTIGKQFKTHISKTFAIFIILFIITSSLFTLCIATMFTVKGYILLVSSAISWIFASIIIKIENIYISL